MCNMRKTMCFLKRMLNVRSTHGKHVNRATHVQRTFIDAHFTYVKLHT